MISTFDLFSIGVGPSSSHTVGPMRAAYHFADQLNQLSLLRQVATVETTLFGSLAHTGRHHGTDKAIMMGLSGQQPESIEVDKMPAMVEQIKNEKVMLLYGQKSIVYQYSRDIIFNLKQTFKYHSNAMRFRAHDDNGNLLLEKVVYSIGGGFIVDDEDKNKTAVKDQDDKLPYPFVNAKQLMGQCEQKGISIAQLMWENECSQFSQQAVKEKLRAIIQAMEDALFAGLHAKEGELPGGLHIERRAPVLYRKLQQNGKPSGHDSVEAMKWVNLYALAVSESNACGGRVVTAPTNGSAGVLPAALFFYRDFFEDVNEDRFFDFLLTAAAIASLYKRNASIAGAEVGCQGEIGVASSMTAAALTAMLGGGVEQIENAAEIAMEHHLGMTCDPIDGLVQIPCIERNAMGAIKAINASFLSLSYDHHRFVSLDKVIATMYQTGLDMNSKYKETSLGGLAVNLPNC